MSRPTVSVIVPSYNYAAVLPGCVQSVLRQEGVDVRLLIIDDCSQDGTAELGREFARRDERVEFRRHERNAGLIDTANEGLEWADGDYVLLLSADDLLVPGALQRAASVMESHPRVGLVYGRALYAHTGRPFPDLNGRWKATDIRTGADFIRRRCRTGHNCISSPEAIVRGSVQRAVGGYDHRCFHTSDLNMWLRIATVSDVAYIRGVPQAVYRIHADSMLRSQHGPMIDLTERRAAFDSFFDSCGAQLEDRDGLRALAGRALARQALWQASRAVDRGLVDGPEAIPVEELVSFAEDVYPDVQRLPEWHGLRLRRRLGAGRSMWFLPFVATGVAHRLKSRAGHLRWKLRGV